MNTRTVPLKQLASIAREELVARARRGELGWRELWTAIDGAGAFLTSVSRGDVVDDTTANRRLATCLLCTHLQRRSAEVVFRGEDAPRPVTVAWCGEPFADASAQGGPCGCLLGLIDPATGVAEPAAKTLVASARCSLSNPRWGAER